MVDRLNFTRRRMLELSGAAATALPLFYIGKPALAAAGDVAEQITAAKDLVAKAAATSIPWDGPTTRAKSAGWQTWCSFRKTKGTAERWASAKGLLKPPRSLAGN